jgi:hypothetical protein
MVRSAIFANIKYSLDFNDGLSAMEKLTIIDKMMARIGAETGINMMKKESEFINVDNLIIGVQLYDIAITPNDPNLTENQYCKFESKDSSWYSEIFKINQ